MLSSLLMFLPVWVLLYFAFTQLFSACLPFSKSTGFSMMGSWLIFFVLYRLKKLFCSDKFKTKWNKFQYFFYFTIFQLFLVPAADLPRAILKCVFLMATIYSLNVFIQMSAQSNPCVRACVLQYLLWEGKRPKLYFIVVYANS